MRKVGGNPRKTSAVTAASTLVGYWIPWVGFSPWGVVTKRNARKRRRSVWVIDLIIECRKAKLRKEGERTWLLDIQELLKRQHERRIRERAERIKRRRRS